jgi:hypothetical protein
VHGGGYGGEDVNIHLQALHEHLEVHYRIFLRMHLHIHLYILL